MPFALGTAVCLFRAQAPLVRCVPWFDRRVSEGTGSLLFGGGNLLPKAPSGSSVSFEFVRQLCCSDKDFMDRGGDLEWISAFPHEEKFVYASLSFLMPMQDKPIVVKIGVSMYQIVPLRIRMA